MSTVEQVTYNSPDGATIGKSASEKVSFYGAVPVAGDHGTYVDGTD